MLPLSLWIHFKILLLTSRCYMVEALNIFLNCCSLIVMWDLQGPLTECRLPSLVRMNPKTLFKGGYFQILFLNGLTPVHLRCLIVTFFNWRLFIWNQKLPTNLNSNINLNLLFLWQKVNHEQGTHWNEYSTQHTGQNLQSWQRYLISLNILYWILWICRIHR